MSSDPDRSILSGKKGKKCIDCYRYVFNWFGAVLRIRDLVLFWRLYPESRYGIRDGKKSGSGMSKMSISDNFSESLVTDFWVKNTLWCGWGTELRELFDPGSKMEKFGSGIRHKNHFLIREMQKVSRRLEPGTFRYKSQFSTPGLWRLWHKLKNFNI